MVFDDEKENLGSDLLENYPKDNNKLKRTYDPNGKVVFVRLGRSQVPVRIRSRSTASSPIERQISWDILRQHLMKRGHTLSSVRL